MFVLLPSCVCRRGDHYGFPSFMLNCALDPSLSYLAYHRSDKINRSTINWSTAEGMPCWFPCGFPEGSVHDLIYYNVPSWTVAACLAISWSYDRRTGRILKLLTSPWLLKLPRCFRHCFRRGQRVGIIGYTTIWRRWCSIVLAAGFYLPLRQVPGEFGWSAKYIC